LACLKYYKELQNRYVCRQVTLKNYNFFSSGNAELCRQISHPSTLRDVKWASQTCSISFQSVGVWPENADGSDVNSVSRSSDGNLLVSGDDWGKVKLYAYPTSQPKVFDVKMMKLLDVFN